MKRKPLDGTHYGEPEGVIRDVLARAVDLFGSPRVLDLGCGRGSRVAWLCNEGFDAWGVDIEPAYLEMGRPYFESRGWDPNRLRLVSEDGTLPFSNDEFHVVLSDQVIEHVQDLDLVVAEIARVSVQGALGLHVFPATLRPIEPHLRAPFVHLLPAGYVRRMGIRLAVMTGRSTEHFANHPERIKIYEDFLRDETAYRLRRTVRGAFERNGMVTDLRVPARAKVASRLPSLPAVAIPLVAALYSLAGQTYIQTEMQR